MNQCCRSAYDGPVMNDDLISKLAQHRVVERIGDFSVGPLDRIHISSGTIMAADSDPTFWIIHNNP